MEEDNRLSIFNIGLLVILVPATIYMFIYVFEIGYMSSYGIPVEIISVDLGRIIPIIINSFPKILLVIIAWFLISEVFSIDVIENPIGFEIYRLFKVVFILLSVSLFSPNSIEYLKNSMFILPFFIFLGFIFPLFSQRKVKGYKEKLNAQNELEYSLSKKNILKVQLHTFGRDNITALMIIMFISLIMYQNGKNVAITNSEYYMYEDKLVVRIYNEYLVCIDYDDKKNVFNESDFEVIIFKNLESLRLKKINLENIKFRE